MKIYLEIIYTKLRLGLRILFVWRRQYRLLVSLISYLLLVSFLKDILFIKKVTLSFHNFLYNSLLTKKT